MILTDYFLRKKVMSLIKHPEIDQQKFISLEKVDSILLVYDYAQRNEVLAAINKSGLKKNWKHLVYTQEKDIKEEQIYSGTIWVKYPELGLWAFPSEKVIDQLMSLRVDCLIDFSDQVIYPLLYLVLKHPSGMKVGLKKPLDGIYDFTLSVNKKEKIAYIFQQIVFYLQSFRRE